MSTKSPMTVEEFARMQTAETEDYELVEGELVPLSSQTPEHSEIRGLIGHFLWIYFNTTSAGMAFAGIDCQLSHDTVRRPDVSIFLKAGRLPEVDEKKIPVPFAPEIAVEVLSLSENAVEVRRKALDYLRAGSKEVWLFDHDNGEAQVHTNSGIRVLQTADVLESSLLPGFTLPIDSVITFRT